MRQFDSRDSNREPSIQTSLSRPNSALSELVDPQTNDPFATNYLEAYFKTNLIVETIKQALALMVRSAILPKSPFALLLRLLNHQALNQQLLRYLSEIQTPKNFPVPQLFKYEIFGFNTEIGRIYCLMGVKDLFNEQMANKLTLFLNNDRNELIQSAIKSNIQFFRSIWGEGIIFRPKGSFCRPAAQWPFGTTCYCVSETSQTPVCITEFVKWMMSDIIKTCQKPSIMVEQLVVTIDDAGQLCWPLGSILVNRTWIEKKISLLMNTKNITITLYMAMRVDNNLTQLTKLPFALIQRRYTLIQKTKKKVFGYNPLNSIFKEIFDEPFLLKLGIEIAKPDSLLTRFVSSQTNLIVNLVLGGKIAEACTELTYLYALGFTEKKDLEVHLDKVMSGPITDLYRLQYVGKILKQMTQPESSATENETILIWNQLHSQLASMNYERGHIYYRTSYYLSLMSSFTLTTDRKVPDLFCAILDVSVRSIISAYNHILLTVDSGALYHIIHDLAMLKAKDRIVDLDKHVLYSTLLKQMKKLPRLVVNLAKTAEDNEPSSQLQYEKILRLLFVKYLNDSKLLSHLVNFYHTISVGRKTVFPLSILLCNLQKEAMSSQKDFLPAIDSVITKFNSSKTTIYESPSDLNNEFALYSLSQRIMENSNLKQIRSVMNSLNRFFPASKMYDVCLSMCHKPSYNTDLVFNACKIYVDILHQMPANKNLEVVHSYLGIVLSKLGEMKRHVVGLFSHTQTNFFNCNVGGLLEPELLCSSYEDLNWCRIDNFTPPSLERLQQLVENCTLNNKELQLIVLFNYEESIKMSTIVFNAKSRTTKQLNSFAPVTNAPGRLFWNMSSLKSWLEYFYPSISPNEKPVEILDQIYNGYTQSSNPIDQLGKVTPSIGLLQNCLECTLAMKYVALMFRLDISNDFHFDYLQVLLNKLEQYFMSQCITSDQFVYGEAECMQVIAHMEAVKLYCRNHNDNLGTQFELVRLMRLINDLKTALMGILIGVAASAFKVISSVGIHD